MVLDKQGSYSWQLNGYFCDLFQLLVNFIYVVFDKEEEKNIGMIFFHTCKSSLCQWQCIYVYIIFHTSIHSHHQMVVCTSNKWYTETSGRMVTGWVSKLTIYLFFVFISFDTFPAYFLCSWIYLSLNKDETPGSTPCHLWLYLQHIIMHQHHALVRNSNHMGLFNSFWIFLGVLWRHICPHSLSVHLSTCLHLYLYCNLVETESQVT